MKKQVTILLLGIALTFSAQAQEIQQNTKYNVEDINDSNYLYNLQKAIYKLLDKYEDSKVDIASLKAQLKNTKAQLSENTATIKSLNTKIETFKTKEPIFKVSEEDKLKIKNFLNEK